MNAKTARILRVLFFVYVAATALHIAYVIHQEPYAFDAWNVSVDTKAEPGSFGRFFAFWKQQYTESNPRIGQPLTYLAYKFGGVAEVGGVIAYLSIVFAGFIVGAGRRPHLRDGRDLATLSIGIGLLWFAAPNFPSYLFCRAYATNYVWTTAIVLWYAAAVRCYVPGAATSPRSLALFALFSIVVGMCNEHVGPTALAFMFGYGLYLRRYERVQPTRIWVGGAGILVGYALLFFAPGQNTRYDEFLNENFSITQRIITRGFGGNIDIYRGLLIGAAPVALVLLGILAVGIVTERREGAELSAVRASQRRAVMIVGLSLLAASMMTITVFASPKLGPRFYMHGISLLVAGVLGVCVTFLHRPRAFAPFVLLAVAASIYAGARTIPMFSRLARDSDTRLAELAATPPGGTYTAPAWEQVNESWWFLGDDMRDQKKRELVARYFGLDRVLFRGLDQWSTLGITDVKLKHKYQFAEDKACLDEVDGLELKPYVGRDVRAIHHAFLDSINEIKRNEKTRTLTTLDLVVTFLGTPPPMPRETVYLARWKTGTLEAYWGGAVRSGRSKEREIKLGPELKKDVWDVYITKVGDEPRLVGKSTDKLTYEPWKSGTYWLLTCKADHCFVAATVTHRI